VFHVSSENQLVDIFTKPLDEQTFCKLRSELNVLDSRNLDWFIAYMCLCLWSCSLCILLFIYGAQVVQTLPGPYKSICKWCTNLGGDVLQLDPLRLTVYLSLLNLVTKEVWKLKGGLGPCKTSTALRWKSNLFQVHLCTLLAFLLLVEDFGEAMGLKGQNWSRFGAWCQRGENKAKAINGSATTCEFWK
jgi:hypothetical protein